MKSTDIIGWLNGIYISTNYGKFILDPSRTIRDKDVKIFISHAHADHTKGFTSLNQKFSSLDTKYLYEAFTGIKVQNYHEIQQNQSIIFDDVAVTALNAGHILGSMQFKVTTPEQTLLYTGDINCINTLTTAKADCCNCDTLIIEATYGDSFYIFPNRERIYAVIIDWIIKQIKRKLIPVFQVYAAGKAQEIIRLINLYTTLEVIVDTKVAAACKIYNSREKDLFYKISNTKNLILEEGHPSVYVTSFFSKSNIDKRYVKAKATGWLLERSSGDNGFFPLSSHADFNQLIQFIKETKAQTVYIYTGYSNELSSYLRRKLKIDAYPLKPIFQRKLQDF